MVRSSSTSSNIMIRRSYGWYPCRLFGFISLRTSKILKVTIKARHGSSTEHSSTTKATEGLCLLLLPSTSKLTLSSRLSASRIPTTYLPCFSLLPRLPALSKNVAETPIAGLSVEHPTSKSIRTIECLPLFPPLANDSKISSGSDMFLLERYHGNDHGCFFSFRSGLLKNSTHMGYVWLCASQNPIA